MKSWRILSAQSLKVAVRYLSFTPEKRGYRGCRPRRIGKSPPLNYSWVYQIKQDFPALTIVLNGGISDLDAAEAQLAHVDGVMLGRAPYQNPWLLNEVDPRIFATAAQHPDRENRH